MKWLIPVIMMFPLVAFAETVTYEVSGMTCAACIKAVKAKVCKLEGIEKCEVSLGKVVISTKTGITPDDQKVKEAVGSAGEYKVTGSSVKK